MKKTKEDIIFTWGRLKFLVRIPAGTRVIPVDPIREPGVYFVDDLSFIDPKKDPILHDDATYIGIRVLEKDVIDG